MFDYYQPRWLYETLPYLYVGSGVLSVATLDHLLSAFSGLLLVSAGLVVWKLRHDHRHQAAADHSGNPTDGHRDHPPANGRSGCKERR